MTLLSEIRTGDPQRNAQTILLTFTCGQRKNCLSEVQNEESCDLAFGRLIKVSLSKSAFDDRFTLRTENLPFAAVLYKYCA
jgi:hypothetical protein